MKWIVLLGVANGCRCRMWKGYCIQNKYRVYCTSWGTMKSVQRNVGLGIDTKKCLHDGVIAPKVLYRTETWGMRSAERKNVNVCEIKCLRSLLAVTRIERVWNEETPISARIEMEVWKGVEWNKVSRCFGPEWVFTSIKIKAVSSMYNLWIMYCIMF